jgi:hypothetical protein
MSAIQDKFFMPKRLNRDRMPRNEYRNAIAAGCLTAPRAFATGFGVSAIDSLLSLMRRPVSLAGRLFRP